MLAASKEFMYTHKFWYCCKGTENYFLNLVYVKVVEYAHQKKLNRIKVVRRGRVRGPNGA